MKLTRDRLKKIIKEELEEMVGMAVEKNPQAVLDAAQQRKEMANAVNRATEELALAVKMGKSKEEIDSLIHNRKNLQNELNRLYDEAMEKLGINNL